jgi:hypothetical protein
MPAPPHGLSVLQAFLDKGDKRLNLGTNATAFIKALEPAAAFGQRRKMPWQSLDHWPSIRPG